MNATWIALIRLLVDVFLSWMKQAGRDEIVEKLTGERDALATRHAQIDARPADPDGAVKRLRERAARASRPA